MEDSINRHFDLSHFALIKVSGEDAAGFLQNQITADINSLEQQGWVLSAWCLPNGRIICNFILFQSDDGFILILPSMLKDTLIKKLSIYILRSKVSITDISDDYAVIGLQGENISNVLNEVNLSMQDQRLHSTDGVSIINFQDSTPRIMLVIDMDKIGSISKRIFMACREGDRNQWSLLDIESGLPWITSQTSESFLPQMLNLDLNGGLSLKKGCYPGQEIIARLHFKGEVKKRMYFGIGNGNTTPGPGDELEYQEDGQFLGTIIDAEPSGNEQFKFLASANVKLEPDKTAIIRNDNSLIIELIPLFQQ